MAQPPPNHSTSSTGASDTLGQRPSGLAGAAEALLREVAARRLFGDEPVRVGRYRITGELGHGGMGIVLDGRDDELDRPVAIKVVPGQPDDIGNLAADRVVHEARALAAIAHPNIVDVFEVGTDEHGVFIAMERVQGPTLEVWLQTPRTWREVVPTLSQAALGLAAAHAEGLTHGDFKPGNVMVGEDGRVRVVDFGLARAVSGSSPELRASVAHGTPAYMAPEQFDGARAGPLADQFSFCVVLYEALYGTRPYRTTSATLPGRVRTPTRSGAPRWVRRALETGLRRDPSERHVSMPALLAALAGPRWPPAATLAVLAAAAGTAAALGIGRPSEPACSLPSQRARQLLPPQRRATIREAFAATERGHAEGTLAIVQAALDDRVQRWADADVALCEANLETRDRSRHTDRVTGCLADRRRRIWAVIETFSVADAQTVDHAVDLVSGLRSVEACTQRIGREPAAVSPSQRAAADALRERLALAEALGATGKLQPAVETIAPLLAEAHALGAEPLVAEVRTSFGEALVAAGDRSRGQAVLEQAALDATAADNDPIAARASLALFGAHATYDGDLEAARHWQRQAEAALQRIGSPPRGRATHLRSSAALAEARGEYSEALALARQAVELSEDGSGLQLDLALGLLGQTLYRAGRYDEAGAALARTVQTQRRLFGDRHPRLGRSLLLSAGVARARSKHGDALSMAREAVGILHDTFGPADVKTLNARAQMGEYLADSGAPEQALISLRETLQRVEETLGDEHAMVVQLLGSLGRVQMSVGRFGAARTRLLKAVELSRVAHGPEHPILATVLSHLGEAHRKLREFELAGAAFREALQIRRRTAGPGRIAPSLEALGRLAEDEGSLPEAVALYEQATVHWTEAYGAEDPNAVATRRIGQGIAARIDGSTPE